MDTLTAEKWEKWLVVVMVSWLEGYSVVAMVEYLVFD